MRVTNARFEGNTIIVELENVPLPDQKYKIVDSEPHVGSWDKEKKIRLDNDIRKKNWLLSLAVHESTEKWIYHTFFSHMTIEKSYTIIHGIAQEVERKYHIKRWGIQSWKEYSSHVDDVFYKENSL